MLISSCINRRRGIIDALKFSRPIAEISSPQSSLSRQRRSTSQRQCSVSSANFVTLGNTVVCVTVVFITGYAI